MNEQLITEVNELTTETVVRSNRPDAKKLRDPESVARRNKRRQSRKSRRSNR